MCNCNPLKPSYFQHPSSEARRSPGNALRGTISPRRRRCKARSRFPPGMTDKKARAKAQNLRTTIKVGAGRFWIVGLLLLLLFFLSFPEGICLWGLERGWELELWVYIFPSWVDSLDEFYLLFAGPVFEFFFAGYGAAHVLEVFEVDEAVDGVTRGVGAFCFSSMGGGAMFQVIGYADVEVSRTAG